MVLYFVTYTSREFMPYMGKKGKLILQIKVYKFIWIGDMKSCRTYTLMNEQTIIHVTFIKKEMFVIKIFQ